MLPELDKEVVRNRIAKRIALDFKDGSVVNLGIGIPTLVSDYIPEDIHITFQTENGVVGAGPVPEVEDLRFRGAGGRCLSLMSNASLVASDFSFGLIRGGHLDATVLGALQVDSQGNLANWWIPGKLVPGMGGAMDLVTGARRVIIATTLLTKKGEPKILEKCSLPLTGVKVVDTVVTEYALFRIIDGELTLCEVAPGVTEDDIRQNTFSGIKVLDELGKMTESEEEQTQ
jgi:3-oxoacid CoA-transferase subunit B/acetate CoA/acetoacetate CoA-transferase beta subunit